MRTTLTIDDDVAIRLKRLRRERDDSFKEIVNDLLRRGLRELERPDTERPSYRIRPHDSGECRLPRLDKTGDVLAWAEGDE
jgi:hypothetical protein